MRTFIFSAFIMVFSLSGSNKAQATALCEYVAFTPSALYHQVTTSLAVRGISLVPARYLTESSDGDLLFALKDGFLFGKVRMSQILAGADTYFSVEDAQGLVLAIAESETYACRHGWCRSTEIRTLIDGGNSAVDAPVIRISQVPSSGLRYSVYGDYVGVTSWRTQFYDRRDWIVDMLSRGERAIYLEVYAPLQRYFLALAAEPEMIPYLGLIKLGIDPDGHLTVSGRVPHGIYNLIVDTALSLGFYDIRPNMIIDSGAAVFAGSTDPDLQRCFGW